MKQIKILAALLILTFAATAQPSALKDKNTSVKTELPKLSRDLKYTVVTDTLSGIFIVYDKEGYLKKQTGKVVRKINVYDDNRLQPEIQVELYYNDLWTSIKREDFYEFKQVIK